MPGTAYQYLEIDDHSIQIACAETYEMDNLLPSSEQEDRAAVILNAQKHALSEDILLPCLLTGEPFSFNLTYTYKVRPVLHSSGCLTQSVHFSSCVRLHYMSGGKVYALLQTFRQS